MIFKKFKVKIFADDDNEYGFECEFKGGLNIIRGDNSSGKSTLVNSLIYSLGMEEIIGSKGPTSLPYALKTYFQLGENKVKIIESVTLVELENSFGEVKTFKRCISSQSKDSKLIEVIHGKYLSENEVTYFPSTFTFVHDPGSAQDHEMGFYAFFEKYLGLELPKIIDNKGKESKLYLQTIFSSLLIEQKRGWTNYIANVPYYGVSNMREKIVTYLLDLDTFRNNKKINELVALRNKISAAWSESATAVKLITRANQLSVKGLSSAPNVDFRKELVSIGESDKEDFKVIDELLLNLADKLDAINNKEKVSPDLNSSQSIKSLEETQNLLAEMMTLQKISNDKIRINNSQIKLYDETLQNVLEDLRKNKLAQKLNNFGAEFELSVAVGKCGTCLQPIDDTLTPPENQTFPMTIKENITHLENQKTMIESLVIGLEKETVKDKAVLLKIEVEFSLKIQELAAIKKDIKSISSINEADLRIKIAHENKYISLEKARKELDESLLIFENLSLEFKACVAELSKITQFEISYKDKCKVEYFEKSFRSLAAQFDYRSAQINEINIKKDTLIPYLGDLELREYKESNELSVKSKPVTDIMSDSSASDFVRLIWAYLISVQKTSKEFNGNHINTLLFDEPAQHSMSVHSVNEMLKVLAKSSSLQSIVAASFDQSDETFVASTTDVSFNLIRLPRKLIAKV